jgi:hypothetical protein
MSYMLERTQEVSGGQVRELLSFICTFRTVLYSLRSDWFLNGIYISGHDYVEQDEGLRCKVCGRVSK